MADPFSAAADIAKILNEATKRWEEELKKRAPLRWEQLKGLIDSISEATSKHEAEVAKMVAEQSKPITAEKTLAAFDACLELTSDEMRQEYETMLTKLKVCRQFKEFKSGGFFSNETTKAMDSVIAAFEEWMSMMFVHDDAIHDAFLGARQFLADPPKTGELDEASNTLIEAYQQKMYAGNKVGITLPGKWNQSNLPDTMSGWFAAWEGTIKRHRDLRTGITKLKQCMGEQ